MADAVVVIAGVTVGLGEQTSGSFTRALEQIDWGKPVPTFFGHPNSKGIGWIETNRPVFASPRSFQTGLHVSYTGANPERNLKDDWEDFAALISPRLSSPVTITVTALDSSGGATSRFIQARPVDLPGNWDTLPRWFGTSGGYYRFPVTWQANCPLFRDTTATTLDLTASNAGTTDSDTIALTGFADVGIRATITAVSGTVTSLTLSNTTTGQTVVWTDAGFALNDYVDFQMTTPNAPTIWASGNAIDTEADLGLELGNNTLTLTAAGTGTWSVTVQLSYRRHWETP